MPIPAARARNFEELLEKQLGLQDGSLQEPTDEGLTQRSQKREFLKRKSKKTVPTSAGLKKYNYYADNFEENKKSRDKHEISAVTHNEYQESSRHQPKQHRMEHQETQRPHTSVREQRPQTSASSDNQQYMSTERQQTETSKPKKKFLTRGQGTAGGRKGYETKSQSRAAAKVEEQL